MARILVLSEAHRGVGDAAAALTAHGHEVRVVPGDGAGARHLATFWPDLVLLHFEGGLQPGLLADVHGWSRAPLMVWARGYDPVEAARALRQGADDYVGGTVAVEEAEAQVVAHLRRARWGARRQGL